MGLRFVGFFVAMFAAVGNAYASPLGPQTITLDGRLYNSTSLTNPLLDSSVTLNVQILNPAKTCVLYEEQQTVDTSTTSGYFNIQVGSALLDPKRHGNDPGNAMA